MDLVPSNKQIIRTFKKLKYFRGKFERFIVFPIICREYYYLRSIQDTQVVLDMPTVLHCLTCKDIETNPIMKNAKDREYCTSLERLCKRVIRRALRQCAMQFSKGITYLNGDCQCESPEVDCEYMSILEKEYRLLSSFDCVPTGSIFSSLSKEISWGECIEIHRRLVDNHNELCTKLGGENLLSIIDYMY